MRQALGVELAAPGFEGPAADPNPDMAFLSHMRATWLWHTCLQAAMASSMRCRPSGHSELVTPDERAPFHLWSFLFLSATQLRQQCFGGLEVGPAEAFGERA